MDSECKLELVLGELTSCVVGLMFDVKYEEMRLIPGRDGSILVVVVVVCWVVSVMFAVVVVVAGAECGGWETLQGPYRRAGKRKRMRREGE